MEEKRVNVTNKQGKKKTNNPLSSLISVGGEGGGGIAGLVVFGGALAVAGYVAVASFARNKNKGKGKGTTTTHENHHQPKPQEELMLLDECGCKSEEDHHHHHEITPQKLHSLLQHSTTTPKDVDAACNWASNMNRSVKQVSPSDLFSAQPLIQEEEKNDHKPKTEEESPTCVHHQEIAFSDYSHPDSATSSNDNAVAEDCLASLFNSLGGQEQEEEEEEENYEPEDNGQKSTESESEEDDIDEDSDGALGSGEDDDSSKGTGCTSLDYNDEPVWHAELIQQEPEPEFRGRYFDNHGCSDSDADDYAGNEEAMTVTNEATLCEKASFCVVQNDKPYSLLKIWVIPTVLLAVLLILALLNRQESFYVLDEGSSVH